MHKIAIIVIDLIPEAQQASDAQLEKEIEDTLKCDWFLRTEKVTVLDDRCH